MEEKRFQKNDSGFICRSCGYEVKPLGVTSRDHCPRCLCSIHIDINPGDRANDCLGLLRPVQVLPDPKKGYVIVYRCEKCGAHYIRKVSNCSNKYRRVFWNCSTFLKKGKSVCHTKQIPEEELYKLSCDVLGMTEFDEKKFKAEIKEITIPDWNVVTFVFYDGTKITKTWQDKSRKWTDEMKLENYENLRRSQKHE